jgi:hypothetical protein
MALIQWKQLDTELTGSLYTGSFNVTGSIFLNGVDLSIDQSIFRQTGSYWNTTNNIGITGSLQIQLDGITDYFAINVAGEEKLKVNTEGVFQLAPLEETPTAVAGGIFYSASDAFYVGLVNS